jgi:hypothetical protein
MTLVTTALACVIALGAALAAQQRPGGIAGTLLDPNGNVIRGYTGGLVTMKNAETGAEFKSEVTVDGTFELGGLPPGKYEFAALITGAMYRVYRTNDVVITAGETLQMKVPIEWGINLGTFGDDPTMLAKDMARSGEKLTGPPPRTHDGKIDLSGVWVAMNEPGGPPNPFPLQPWAEEMQKKLQAARGPDAQNPGAYCLPQSAVLTMAGFPYKFVQADTVIVQIVEFATPGWRQIFLDGRPHPAPDDWNPAWHGHAVGRWEGDTLVVDSVGFNEVAPGFGIHTEKLHVVERIRRPAMNRLEVEITAEDPDAFTRPWTTRRTLALAADQEILEFVCPENNKDAITFGGLGWKGRP